jgi:hypothetical protein
MRVSNDVGHVETTLPEDKQQIKYTTDSNLVNPRDLLQTKLQHAYSSSSRVVEYFTAETTPVSMSKQQLSYGVGFIITFYYIATA